MQIDWLTIGAQVVNFLLLVFLLQHFLYGPVTRAMDKREKRITDRLREAAEREQAAQRKADDYDRRIGKIDDQRREVLAEAEEQAERERRERLQQAREEIEQSERRWRRDLKREQREFLDDVRSQLAAAVQLVARKALADLADAELEKQMLGKLLGQLDRLDDEARRALVEAEGGVTVRSAFALDSNQRSQTTRALHERLGREVPVRYEKDDSLACGLALDGGGHRLGWNLAEYLQGVEQRLRERLAAIEAEAPQDEPQAEPKAEEAAAR